MHPDPILSFSLFGTEINIYLYGVCIAVGLLACIGVFFLYSKKANMPQKIQDFTFFVAIVAIAFGFLFSKLFQAVYDWIETGKFDFYGSGITAMGGFVGGAITFLVVYFLAGRYMFKGEDRALYKKELNTTFCIAPISITIAHAFGRIGCLMAGCCYGMESDSGFTLHIHGADRIPVQLYESLFLFALFGVLSLLYFKRSNITMHIYLIAYGIWRIIIEFFRVDARGAVILGLAPSQWQSIIFILTGVILFIVYAVKKVPFTRTIRAADEPATEKE